MAAHRSSLRKYLSAALVLLCPFLMGAANPILVSVLSLLFLASLTAEYVRHKNIALPTPALCLLALAALALLGIFPLPHALVALLSPNTAILQQEAAELTEASTATLSLSPLQSLVGIQHILLGFYVFLLGSSVLSSTRWQRRLPRWLGLAGGGMALVVGIPLFSGVTAVYGVYPSSSVLPAPLINMNHLAAFAGLCFFCALASLQHAKDWQPSALWLSATASLWLVIESQSRAGVAALVLSLGLFFFLRYQDVALRKRLGLALLSLVAMAIAALLFFGDQLTLYLQQLAQDIKVQMWRDVLSMLPDFWLLGVGKSSLSEVFPQYQSFAQPFMVRSAEQLLLGTWVELGLLGVAISSCFLWSFRGVLQGKRDLFLTGVLSALCSLLLHDLADFSLALAGVAVPAAVLAGNLYKQQLTAPRYQLGKVLLALCWLVSTSLSIAVYWAEQHSEERSIQAVEDATRENIKETATAALRLRPLYGYLHLATAERLLREREAVSALPYLTKARLLLPQDARVHLLAGRALSVVGRYQQARIEYRAALESKLSLDWYQEASLLATSDTAMLQLSPYETQARAMFRDSLATNKKLPFAIGVAWSLVLHPASEAKDWKRLAELCLTGERLEEALVAILHLERLGEQSGFLLHAQLASKQQDSVSARQVLQEAVQKWPQDGALLLAYASALLANGQEESALLAARKSRSLGAPQDASFLLEGSILEQQQRLESAKQLYLSAIATLPKAEGLRVSLARVYEKQGNPREALGIFRQLQRDNPKYQSELERLERVLQGP